MGIHTVNKTHKIIRKKKHVAAADKLRLRKQNPLDGLMDKNVYKLHLICLD